MTKQDFVRNYRCLRLCISQSAVSVEIGREKVFASKLFHLYYSIAPTTKKLNIKNEPYLFFDRVRFTLN